MMTGYYKDVASFLAFEVIGWIDIWTFFIKVAAYAKKGKHRLREREF
jgi:hypothetical protein